MSELSGKAESPRVLYCHCKFARIIDDDVKRKVLAGLVERNIPFESVPDLCEMSARKDPALAEFGGEAMQIVACFPRAVKWLFHGGGVELKDDRCEVLNMREQDPDEILDRIGQPIRPPSEVASE